MDLSQSQISAIKEWALSTPEIAEVKLFGSRARGDAKPYSDVDLAIVIFGTEGDQRGEYAFERANWEAQLSLKLWLRADIELYIDESISRSCDERSEVLFSRR